MRWAPCSTSWASDQAEARRQSEIFRTIPGLENAVFARLGGVHRNTFLNSPRLLDATLQLKARPGLRFAGQITGVEGYVESAAMGLLAGRFAAAEALGPGRRAAAADHRPGRPAGPRHGGPRGRRLPAHEHQLRPAAADGGPATRRGGRKLPSHERGRAKKRSMSVRALADLDGWLLPARAAAE
jgi:methylenetetrahydrofolate--tRNA-(uracil-5-)-methyltransferase